MDKKKADEIVYRLSKKYLDKPALKYNSIFELLIAVILSAQCTDERVNKVTNVLFKEANTPAKIIELGEENLQKYIFSCGLYKSKAEHIVKACKEIINKFNGQVPGNLEDLRLLSGVGRKTANVIYSVGFNGDAIAVDTHVFRVSNRIGLANSKNVFNTEKDLMNIIDKDKWSKVHHYIIYHGREICKAQNPKCQECFLNDLCENKVKITIKEN